MGLFSRLFGRGLQGSTYYRGASQAPRVANFYAPRTGPNAAIVANAPTLAARAYALERNEPFVWRGISALCAMMVGTGVEPESQVEDTKLQQAIMDLWDAWTESADAAGRTDFYGLQVLALRAVLMGGDAFIRLRPRRTEDGLPVPLQLEVLEAAMCPHEKTETLGSGRRIIAGIEFGPIGNRVAYHLYREHPADFPMTGALGGETTPVPAAAVLHVHEMSRPGQVRGEPRLARIIIPAFDFLQGEDALQRAWNIAAAITGAIQKPNAMDVPPGSDPAHGSALAQPGDSVDAQGNIQTVVEHGTIFDGLMPGEEMQFFKAPEVGQTYDTATTWRARRMASGLGVPVEPMTGNYEGVTYSSVRSALLQAWAECDQQLWATHIPQFHRPAWLAWFDAAVRADRLPIRLQDYLRASWTFTKHTWNPPKRDWVDPLKDVQAEIKAIEAGIKSLDEVIRSRGRRPDQVARERKRAMEREQAMGLATVQSPPVPVTEDAPPANRRAA